MRFHQSYQGRPRSEYFYCGPDENRDLFEQWQNGAISTDEFQTRTDQGEGTAALSARPCNFPFDSGTMTMVAVVGILLFFVLRSD